MKLIIFLFLTAIINIQAMNQKPLPEIPKNKSLQSWPDLSEGTKLDIILKKYNSAKIVHEKAMEKVTYEGKDKEPSEADVKLVRESLIQNGLKLVIQTEEGEKITGFAYLKDTLDPMVDLLQQSKVSDTTIVLDLTNIYNVNNKFYQSVLDLQKQQSGQGIPIAVHNQKMSEKIDQLNQKHKTDLRKTAFNNFFFGAATIGGIWTATKLFVWWQSRKVTTF